MIMRYDDLTWLRRLWLVTGCICLLLAFVAQNPTQGTNASSGALSLSKGIVQEEEPKGSYEDLDLTGNLMINAADADMVAEAWEVMVEEGDCRLSSSEMRSLFAKRDINKNDCLSVADVQSLLSHWGEPADASAPPLTAPNSAARKRAVGGAASATFVVNVDSDESDSNPGDGICQNADGNCTLRAALEESNVSAGYQTITFDIRDPDGSCPDLVTLQPSTPLVMDDVNFEGMTVDGYTQCGASANTEDVVGNAQIKIEIKGDGTDHFHGLEIKSPYNTVRGLAIYDFDPQLHFSGAASHNRIQGSFFGTNAANTFTQLGDYAEGMRLRWGASYNIIGCGSYDENNSYQACQTQAEFNAARNIIAGNNGDGIVIEGDVTMTRFIGNYVGLKQDGSTALRNSSDGLDFGNGPQENWVGGTLAGERNVVSGNLGDGVEFSHSTTTKLNYLVGNYIGVDATGSQAVRNRGNGVTLEDTVDSIQIYDNVISGNGANGVRLYMLITNAQIYNNFIGVAADGVTPMPNGSNPDSNDGRAGVYAMGGSQYNRIHDNVIANNFEQGIHLSNRSDYPSGFGETFYNTISQNSIYNNGTSGITLNPSTDPSTGELTYPNEGLSPPELTTAATNLVAGSACANCTVELFIADKDSVNDPSGENNGEGKSFIASTVADSNGNFSVSISGVTEGQILTATATDSQGNTSKFAANVAVEEAVVLTPTPTASVTATITPTVTLTPSATPTMSVTATITPTVTLTPSVTPTMSVTATITPTVTLTPSATPTASVTATATLTPSVTLTPSATPTASVTATLTPTVTLTPSATPTVSVTATLTPTATPVASGRLRLDILNWADDAEERFSDNKTYRGSSDLELTRDGGNLQIVGLRYQNTIIPQGATITQAYIELTVDETGNRSTTLIFHGQASDHAERFRYQISNLSSRPITSASLEWQNVPQWNIVHETHQTPDISPIIQEIVDRPGWRSGNALALFITGTGQRTAEAYDGEPELAPALHIQYTVAGPDLPAVLPTSTPEPIPERFPGDSTIEPALWLPLIIR